MMASTIEDLADAAELSLPDDVLIELDENGEMQGRGPYGYAWPDGSKITLYPDAFEGRGAITSHVGPRVGACPAGTHRRTADEQRRTRGEGARGVR